MIISGWMPMLRSSCTLCCVGLVFSSLGRADVGQPGHVNVEDVVAAHVFAHLADRFQERQAFDVADRAADFDDHHVGLRFFARPGRCGA